MRAHHEIAHGSVRLSYGESNAVEETKFIVDLLKETVERLRLMSPLEADKMQ